MSVSHSFPPVRAFLRSIRAWVPQFLAVLLVGSTTGAGAPDSNDDAFMAVIQGSAGVGKDRGFSRPLNAVAQLPDGRLLVGGNEGTLRGGSEGVLWALNPDGTLDRVITGFAVPDGDPEVNELLVLPDGSVLVGGVFASFDGAPRSALVKLRPDLTLDTAFAPSGAAGTLRYVNTIVRQPDGRILVGGWFSSFNGVGRTSVTRLLPDGTTDPSFAPISLQATGPGGTFPATVDTVALQDDGRILVSGGFNRVAGQTGGNVVRLNSDGSLDRSFLAGTGAEYRVNKVAVLADGSILLGGLSGTWQGVPVGSLVKVSSTGVLDTAFQAAFGNVNGWTGGAILNGSDGSVYIAGIFNSFAGVTTTSIARIKADGTMDEDFNPVPHILDRGGYGTHVYDLLEQADGKIVAVGWMNEFDSTGPNSVPITINGAPIHNIFRLEGGFSAGPGRLQFAASAVTVAENSGTATFTVTRVGGVAGAVSVSYAFGDGVIPSTATAGDDFEAVSGTLSWTAGQGGSKTFTVPIANDAVLEGTEIAFVTLSGPSGGAVLGSPSTATLVIRDDEAPPVILVPPIAITVSQGDTAVLFVAVDSVTPVTYQWFFGDVPIPFATSAVHVINAVSRLTHEGSYRVRVTNAAGSVDSVAVDLTVRIPAGSVDPTFFVPSGLGSINYSAVFPDGSMVVFANSVLRRLLPNGTLDPAWVPPTFDSASSLYTIAAIPDGRLIVAGAFTTINGVSSPRIAVLAPDGSLAAGFTSPYATNASSISAVHVQIDGRIIVGTFSGGQVRRLNANGTFDTSFSTITAGVGSFGSVHTIITLGDGRVAIASAENPSFGSLSFRVALYGANGVIDASFSPLVLNNRASALAALPDGRIALAGSFGTINGVARARVAIVGADGRLDESFDARGAFVVSGRAATGIAWTDGRLVVTGEFSPQYGDPVGGVVRLNLDGSIDATFEVGVGFNLGVNAVSVLADGRLVLAGPFTSYRGQVANGAVRLIRGPGSVGFARPSLAVGETAGTVQLVVQRLGDLTGPASIDYATGDGTAEAGPDYVAASGTLSWADGEGGPRQVALTILNDSVAEPTLEQFRVVLSNPQGAITLASSLAQVVVTDDDNPPVITRQPVSQAVAQGTAVTFSVEAVSVPALSYQWRKGTEILAGRTSATLQLTGVQVADAGDYTCVVTNVNGSVESAAARLTILLDPVFLATDFVTGGSITGSVLDVVALRDGGAIIAGDFTNFRGVSGRDRLLRLSPTGEVVTSFAASVNNTVTRVVVAHGKVFAIGTFSTAGGQAAKGLAAFDLATGALDTAFLTATGTGVPTTGSLSDIAVAPDGDLLLGGNQASFNGSTAHQLVTRLNSTGTLDAEWSMAGAAGVVQSLAVDRLGRVVAAGSTLNVGGQSRLVRLLPNGVRDTTFIPVISSSSANTRRVVALRDGRVMLAGTNVVSNRSFAVVGVDGSYSTSTFFGTTSGTYYDGIPLADGGFLGVGEFSLVGVGGNVSGAGRYGATGSYDNTFVKPPGFGGRVNAVDVTPEGVIWAAGAFTAYNGAPVPGVVRLNGVPVPLDIITQPDTAEVLAGTDVTFEVEATGTSTLSYQWLRGGVPVVDGGRVSGARTARLSIIGATVADEGFYTVLVSNASGQVESESAELAILGAPEVFGGPEGIVTAYVGRPLILTVTARGAPTLGLQWQRDGVPIAPAAGISGLTSTTLTITSPVLGDAGDYQLVATNAQGSVVGPAIPVRVIPYPSDQGPDRYKPLVPSATTTTLRSILNLPDGSALVGGNFNFYGDGTGATSGARLARIQPDGRVVPSSAFNLGLNGDVTLMVRRRDGSIVLHGGFTTVSGVARAGLALLRPDFTLDPDWNPGAVASGTISAIAEDSNGRVYLGGNFTGLGGNGAINYLGRLRANGTVDASYAPVVDNQVYALAMEPDDQLLVGGNFLNLDGQSLLARMNADGTRDRTFNPSVSTIRSLVLRPDGRIVAGGAGGFLRGYLPSGALDPSFAGGASAFNNTVTDLALQANGRIVAIGNFTTYLGAPRNLIARIEPDGTLDTRFADGTTFTGNSPTPSLQAVEVDRDGHIWVGGAFRAYNNAIVNAALVVLHGDAVDLAIAQEPADAFAEAGQPVSLEVTATGTTALFYRWMKDGVALEDGAGISGASTARLQIAAIDASKVGSYVVEVSNDSGSITSRAATVGILAAPEVLDRPADVVLDLGTSITFSVVARGAASLTYTWSKDNVALVDGPRVTGASMPTLQLSGLVMEDSGTYRLAIANGFGEVVVPVQLTVVRRPGQRFLGWSPPSFNSNVKAFLPLEDGSVLVGGDFSTVTASNGSATRRGLVRILADGRLDLDFVNLLATGGGVEDLAADAQGRVYVVGSLTRTGVFSRYLRLRPVATTGVFEIDPTFVPPAVNNTVFDVAIDDQGRPWIGGGFSTITGALGSGYVARLNPETGAIDTSFVAAAGATVYSVLPIPGGGAWIGGTFTNWGLGRNLVKVGDTGTRDTAFEMSPFFNVFVTRKVGSVLLAGSTSNPGLRAYDSSTGALLASPALESSVSISSVTDLELDSRGRILMGGGFTLFGSTSEKYLVRLLPTGVRDTTFSTGTGFNSDVSAMLVREDGTIWVGGSFSQFQGNQVGRFIVLNGDAPPVAGGFEAFASEAGLSGVDAGFAADPDRDGIANLLEYVVGGDPRSGSRALQPGVATRRLEVADGVSTPGDYLVVTLRVRVGLVGATPSVEIAADPSTLLAGNGAAGVLVGTVPDPDAPDSFELRTWRTSAPIGGTSSTFLRIRVEPGP